MTNFKMLNKLFIIITIHLLFSGKSYSQFTDAIEPEYAVGVIPVYAANTGNDILDKTGITYQVNVWDDTLSNNAGMSWKVGASTGFLSFAQPNSNFDPDVCLLKNAGGGVYAVATYYNLNASEFYWEYFTWVNSQQAFVSGGSFLIAPGAFGKTLNIDANDAGEFVIVWDEPGQVINLLSGKATGGNPPQLNNGGASLLVAGGTYPDVCIFRNNTGANQVDLTFVTSSNQIAVDFHQMSDLILGNINPINAYRSAQADLFYKYPRIACPSSYYGNVEDWTVVTEDTDGASSWYIKSFNVNKCCVPDINLALYNDGSNLNSPYNITDLPNTRPVVSYDNLYESIWVGWNFDNSMGLLTVPGAARAKYPIAFPCSKQAKIRSGQDYLVVPTVIPFNSSFRSLSIAGRNSSQCLFTYHHAPFEDIFSKTILHFPVPGNLKELNDDNIFLWLEQYNINNESGKNNMLSLKLIDVSGREVLNINGTSSRILNILKSFSENANANIYFAMAYTADGKSSYSGKSFLGN